MMRLALLASNLVQSLLCRIDKDKKDAITNYLVARYASSSPYRVGISDLATTGRDWDVAAKLITSRKD